MNKTNETIEFMPLRTLCWISEVKWSIYDNISIELGRWPSYHVVIYPTDTASHSAVPKELWKLLSLY